MNKLRLYIEILRNMGLRYFLFRIGYEIQRKLGVFKKKFPTHVEPKFFISLEDWKKSKASFFFDGKESLFFPKNQSPELKNNFEKITSGNIPFFNAQFISLGLSYDWITNPSNGYKYDISKHWSDIPDLSEEAGDIKYVWEKSRFSYVYDVIRYDYHFEKNCDKFVFQEIESWIDANPTNMGPNYRCSQEISLRILNWLFALYYYQNSSILNEHLFVKIISSIYWQLKHVRSNINFSRIAVRNNHAVTEVMMLYLSGIYFPFFKEAKNWALSGEKWLKEEILYQVYEDGSYLQFSHNYHRVFLQLMTWLLYTTENNAIELSEELHIRIKKTINYLFQCSNEKNGQLPNYGANDGALFFKLNNNDYRDYRAQLNAIYFFYTKNYLFDEEHLKEDTYWFSSKTTKLLKSNGGFDLKYKKLSEFKDGGYYTIRDKETLTFIKCGSYKDRPSHADNLHIDIWFNNENIIRDAGTYRYNTSSELVHYFNGSKAHNTVLINNQDQMKKGPRFIWFKWSNRVKAELIENPSSFVFEGKIHAFKHLDDNIYHTRKVTKVKNQDTWIIEDSIEILPKDGLVTQVWNISSSFDEYFSIVSIDGNTQELAPNFQEGFYSSYYGVKEIGKVIHFNTNSNYIKTTITKL